MREDEDESLAEWAARREQRRRPVGKLRAVRLADGQRVGAHVTPDEPRLIMRWDGYQWLPDAVVEDYAAAQRALYGVEGDGVVRSDGPTPGHPTPGLPTPGHPTPGRPDKAPGRHRKPS